MFIAVLFTVARTWKQLECPSIDEWIKKMWYMYMCIYIHTHTYICTHTHTHIYTIEYYSAVKKNEIMPFAATWMDLQTTILSEVSQKKTNTI